MPANRFRIAFSFAGEKRDFVANPVVFMSAATIESLLHQACDAVKVWPA